MFENLSPIEPLISTNYLNAADKVIPDLEGVLEEGFEKRIKPAALENSPYFLSISTFLEKNGVYVVSMAFVDENNHGINRRESGCNLSFFPDDSKKEILVGGSFFNNSAKEEIKKSPLRNMSGVIAPYEDAICMMIATKYEDKKVIRKVVTRQKETSRFVKNFEARGYSSKKSEDEKITLQKDFSPLGEHPELQTS